VLAGEVGHFEPQYVGPHAALLIEVAGCGFSICLARQSVDVCVRLADILPAAPLPIESAAVQPAPAINLLAPAPSTTKATANTLERHVGALVAAAGMAIAAALEERRHGALSPTTRQRGGDLICELVRLRLFLIVDLPDFDRVARAHGVAMLRAADVSLATATVLVDEVLDLMHKVIRVALN